MRVGINCHAMMGGPSSARRIVSGLAQSLCAAAPADFISLYVPMGFDRSAVLASDNLSYIRSWFPGGNRTLRVAWEQFILHSRVFDDKLDLLHCPFGVMPAWCLKPVVVTVPGVDDLVAGKISASGDALHLKRFLPRTLARARRVIVPANSVKRQLLDLFPEAKGGKIAVIPFGIGEMFRPVTDEAARRAMAARHGLPERFVLHVGDCEPRKNITRLVQAFFAATISRALPHHLVLVGRKGREGKRLARMVLEHGLDEKVHILREVGDEDLAAIMSLADCAFFPSLISGFPFAALEAMACGAPVVAADIPIMRETLGDAAELAKPEELPRLRESLEAVLANPERSQQLSVKGRERASLFVWEKCAKQTIALYEEVLADVRRES